MLCVVSASHHAPFNIASEEYILREFAEDVFLLYRNAPSIIVGRHQNTLAEINADYVREQGLPVVRRLTGGGTVFHDLGNLNFSFIMRREGNEEGGFARFTAPILAALEELGVAAQLEGRNDLTIDGMKFSGNARAVHRDKIQQHGTILFASRIADLTSALRANPLKFRDKAVKSVASRVTNVSDHLREPLELDDFVRIILRQVLRLYPDAREYSFSEADRAATERLVEEKYGRWEWNFGQSPSYNHVKAIRCAAGTIEFHTDVHRGRVTGLRIYGDFFGDREIGELEAALIGLPHRENELRAALEQLPLAEFFGAASIPEILSGLI